MNIVNLTQGTPEWAAHRAQHFNASDAPAMMGCSPYKTRTQLLHELHTGLTADVDAGTQRRFDDGHRFEALARPLAEKIIGEELSPVVATSGKLSASFDGITFMGDALFEHKTLNDELRACIVDEACGALLPLHYRVQMEQQLLIAGADKCLFMATKWNGTELAEQRWTWYFSDEVLRAQIVAGWEQFAADLAAYVPSIVTADKPTGKAPDTLPALRIEVTGMVTASNLAEFKETALTAIRSVNRELVTDADFANAEASVKWCEEVESRLKAAKEHALSQTASIDQLFKTIDDISAEARKVRLELDKLVKGKKEELRGQIVRAAQEKLTSHVSKLNDRIGWINGCPVLSVAQADFAGVIKGKRSLASIQDAADTELARVKIELSRIADVIQQNRVLLVGLDAEHLFPDFAQVCQKSAEDFTNLIASRKTAEQARIEAERERIRAEEAARLEREAKAAEQARIAAEQQAEQERQRVEAQQKREAEAAAQPDPVVVPAPAVAAPVVAARQIHPAAQALRNEQPTLTLGVMKDRLGFALTADFLTELGFEATPVKAARLYRESDFGDICAALVRHIESVRADVAAAA